MINISIKKSDVHAQNRILCICLDAFGKINSCANGRFLLLPDKERMYDAA